MNRNFDRIMLVLMILIFSLLLTGCADQTPEGSVTSIEPTENSELPTSPPQPTNTRVPQYASLEILQILTRYQADQESGTLEVTVCNRGKVASQGFILEISVDDVMVEIQWPEKVPPGLCRDVVDLANSFETYGITAPGEYTITAVLTPDFPEEVSQTTVLTENLSIAFLDVPDTIPSVTSTTVPFREDPLEVLKVFNQYSVMVPAEWAPFASFAIYDNRICISQLTAFFGVEQPVDVYMGYYLDSDFGTPGGFWSKGFGIGVPADQFFLNSLTARLDYFWEHAFLGECGNGHELTHLIVNGGPMPGWLNEGLATYMESPERGGRSDRITVACQPDGFTTPTGEFVAHLSLLNPDFDYDLDPILYYYSASCFWEHIDENYGQEAVAAIVREVVENSATQVRACAPLDGIDFAFMRDIVVPLLGTDILDVTQQNWNFGTNYTGCEF